MRACLCGLLRLLALGIRALGLPGGLECVYLCAHLCESCGPLCKVERPGLREV